MDEGLRARSRGRVSRLSLGHVGFAGRDARRPFDRRRASERCRLQTHGTACGAGDIGSIARKTIVEITMIRLRFPQVGAILFVLVFAACSSERILSKVAPPEAD